LSYTGRKAAEGPESDDEFVKVEFKNDHKVIILNITAGKAHVLCLDNDHSIWGWGSNAKNQINPDKDSQKNYEIPIKLIQLVI
jgi:alpha-tubulin suppressor-like RCC1 family protein